MGAVEFLTWCWCMAALLMLGMWWLQRRTGNAGLVDVFKKPVT